MSAGNLLADSYVSVPAVAIR